MQMISDTLFLPFVGFGELFGFAAAFEVPSDLRWQDLSHLIGRRCVAFVGAGFSAPAGMPNWEGLLKALIDRVVRSSPIASGTKVQINTCLEAIGNAEFQLAGSLVARLLQPPEIIAEINSQFGIHRLHNARSELRRVMEERLQSLLLLPWQGIITTNYDKLIEYGLQTYAPAKAVEAIDAGRQLGTLLCQPAAASIYLAKIHGSTDIGRVVLSAEEYGETYYRTPKMERFLSAVTLTSTFVFLGCSLDDETINLRRRLVAEFEGHIPLAYALIPHSKQNVRRADWLQSTARIRVILYDDPTHAVFDLFLKSLVNEVKRLTGDLQICAETTSRLNKLSVAVRWNEIGRINQELLTWIHRRGSHVDQQQVGDTSVSSAKTTHSLPKLVAGISSTERIYRLLFLVSIGLLTERLSNGKRFYVLDPDVQDYLDDG